MDPREMKRRGRGISDDMSPQAIARRLDLVGELWRLWRTLRAARRIGPVEPPSIARTGADPRPERGRGD